MSDTQHSILITRDITPAWKERLQNISPNLNIEIYPAQDVRDIPAEIWQKTEILHTIHTLPTPEQAPNLRWVQLFSAGADRALSTPLFHGQTLFTTASGVHAVNIAEYVLMMQLALFHHLPLITEWQRNNTWTTDKERDQMFFIEELRDKTIGIVGYGSIGREIARLSKAFGMRVVALQRNSDHRDHGFIFPGVGDPDGSLPDHYYNNEQLHDLLRESDVVVLAVPLTPDTTHLFSAAEIRAMKSSALLINIARGEVCDQDALIQALQDQQIAGAALDVTTPEPLPADNLLWHLPNVIVSPHISGGTNRYEERVLMIFEANLQRYLSGSPLPLYNLVDKKQGY